MDNRIRNISFAESNQMIFSAKYTGCLILTKQKQLLLQQRSKTCFTHPGMISTFGGKIEAAESPVQALQRELHEELGAKVAANELLFIGAITEAITNHRELVYEYFWHDKNGSITGCYEESPCYFDNIKAALDCESKLMDDVIWLLAKCSKLELIA